MHKNVIYIQQKGMSIAIHLFSFYCIKIHVEMDGKCQVKHHGCKCVQICHSLEQFEYSRTKHKACKITFLIMYIAYLFSLHN